MIAEDRVWTILVESNPIPDLDSLQDVDQIDIAAYLATLEERSSEVTQLDDRKTAVRSRRIMTGWLVAAVAVILIGVVVVLSNQEPANETPPATQPPPQPVTTAAPEAAEVTAVLAAIEAFNAGNAEAWRAAFVPSSDEVIGSRWTFQTNNFYIHEVMMAANEQLTVVGECVLTSLDPATVECLIGETNDWHGKGGITHDIDTTFILNDEMLITSWTFGYGCCDDEFAFNRAFQLWMRDAYPGVYEEIRAVDLDSFPGFERDPAHMTTALQYVDEFLAQSDQYPADLHTRVVGES